MLFLSNILRKKKRNENKLCQVLPMSGALFITGCGGNNSSSSSGGAATPARYEADRYIEEIGERKASI